MVAGEPALARQRDVVVEPLAGGGEDAVEHVAQGEDGGAGIDQPLPDLDLAQLAAGTGRALHHRDADAATREVERRHEASDARAHHGDVKIRHEARSGCGPGRRASVQFT